MFVFQGTRLSCMHCKSSFIPEPLLCILFQIHVCAPVWALSIFPCLSRFKKFRLVFLRFETFSPQKAELFSLQIFSKRQSREARWRHSCISSLRTYLLSVSPVSLLLQCQAKFKYKKKFFEFPSSAPSLLGIEGCYGHIRFSCSNSFLNKKFPGLELVSSHPPLIGLFKCKHSLWVLHQFMNIYSTL